MRTAFFSTHRFDRDSFQTNEHDISFFEASLDDSTSSLATGFPAVCAFVNDRLNTAVLHKLKAGGTQYIVLRSAGFNHVDLESATQLGLKVARVPAYSPNSVAEHTVGLMLCLNRKLHRAYARTREHNFLLDGLLGFDFCGRTVGLVGAGKIGGLVQKIMQAFGCRVLVSDPALPDSLELAELLSQSDIVSLHCPLTPATHHLIGRAQLAVMKPGAMLINTGRGGLIDSRAVLAALKSGQLGALGLDVYEEEESHFFRDLSDKPLQDDILARLLTFPNVLITAHQGFFTQEALANIARTTLENLSSFERKGEAPGPNRLPYHGASALSSSSE
ncbi:MAG: 2-hydroxyacid dehydrogenase [Candidatus Eremiobacteraeota bacterium]|nr:2-hydroxyacid dehydrogenase [Candidatus Eremiobacteraeota bacterium]MCW5866746.1 2-hydroxyacid dehydrogenase [Candidatus Eremiobacteraeota bacterium]